MCQAIPAFSLKTAEILSLSRFFKRCLMSKKAFSGIILLRCEAYIPLSTIGLMQAFREKINAEVEGRKYTPPPASQLKASKKPQSGGARTRGRGGDEEWDDWGVGKASSKVVCLCLLSV